MKDFSDLTLSFQKIDEEIKKLQGRKDFIFESLMFRMHNLESYELHQIENEGNPIEKKAAKAVLAVMFGEH